MLNEKTYLEAIKYLIQLLFNFHAKTRANKFMAERTTRV